MSLRRPGQAQLALHRLHLSRVYTRERPLNKSRGIRLKPLRAALLPKPVATLTQQQLRFSLTWPTLIKLVYEALC